MRAHPEDDEHPASPRLALEVGALLILVAVGFIIMAVAVQATTAY